VLDELGIRQITDSDEIRKAIRQVMESSPKQLEQFRAGKAALFGYFVGQVMKATGGQANPQKLNELLKEELGGS
jgi:aspartyl-tRNA(Asn)/glutamyl-tRNA(Gln) amidotransferase subunit B